MSSFAVEKIDANRERMFQYSCVVMAQEKSSVNKKLMAKR